MFKLRFLLVCVMFLIFTCCTNVDYLNNIKELVNINVAPNEIFNSLSSKLSLPTLKSLNENELLELYAIDPKILTDYIANVPNDNISGIEISIFRLKEKENATEVILGIERRVKELEKEFRFNENKKLHYDLIKNPYIETFDNYVIFALYNDVHTLDSILHDILAN